MDDEVLTRLQECLDQLNTQFYASLRYISSHHTASPLTELPSTNAPAQSSANAQPSLLANGNGTKFISQSQPKTPSQREGQYPQPQLDHAQNHHLSPLSQRPATEQPIPPHLDPSTILPPEQRPDSPRTFAAAQRELAHDLILKTQQIDTLIRKMPGVDRELAGQEARIEVLEDELRGVLEERENVERERKEWTERIEEMLIGVRR